MPIDIEKDDLKTALKKLKARENAFKQLEAISKLGSWELDLKTKISHWSEQSYKIYGFKKDEVTPTLDFFLSLLLPEYKEQAKESLQLAIKTGKAISFKCKTKRADDKIIDLLLNAQVVYDEDGTPSKLIGTTQDTTESMNALREADELSRVIKYSTNEIYIIDGKTLKYIYVNDGAKKALGYTSKELLELNIFDINPKLTHKKVHELQKLSHTTNKVLNRSIHKRKDGSTYYVQSLIHNIQYKGKDAVAIFSIDITKQVESELLLQKQAKELNYQATHDSLTKLPNRLLFQDRLSQTISWADRHKKQFALLFLDLDQFKKINDSLGHHVGDDVLIDVSYKLKSLLRKEDTLARLGGDEFTIIIKDIKNIQSASKVAQKIINLIRQPLKMKEHTLFISTSIGISIYPQDATQQENLIKFADSAMYKAKDEGRNNFQFYSADMTTQAYKRVIIENKLRDAIEKQEFEVYFQPQFNPNTNTIKGMEALVRWIDADGNIISPANFIPIAEESGLIVEIDRIVMQKAMKQFAIWYSQGLKPGILSLNLAMKQLSQNDFLNYLKETMKSINFKAKWLELEVTEGDIMRNPEESIQKLHQIHKEHILLAIDDFGTGYSSLAYLKKLPLDKLKIDQSFIRDIPTDEDDMAITKAIIALANSLNLNLIAEGVETDQQKDFLLKEGCQDMQGYLFSKPVPASDMTNILKNGIL